MLTVSITYCRLEAVRQEHLAEFMEKLPGDEAQKLSQVRAAYAYMMMHPGCTMMAPGKELPEEMEKFIHDLNELYRTHPALIQKDDEYDGFEWIQLMKYEENVLDFHEKDRQAGRNTSRCMQLRGCSI